MASDRHVTPYTCQNCLEEADRMVLVLCADLAMPGGVACMGACGCHCQCTMQAPQATGVQCQCTWGQALPPPCMGHLAHWPEGPHSWPMWPQVAAWEKCAGGVGVQCLMVSYLFSSSSTHFY